jgi:hypothetical protein
MMRPGHRVFYHFFDEVFRSLDWTKEPTQSVEELYLERAKQLRAKYDYITLAFSGGSDSTNMLNVFLDNNIPIEEIVTYYPVSIIEKMLPNFNKNDTSPENIIFEYIESAAPKLREVAKTHPEIKITVIDYAQRAIEVVGKSALHTTTAAGVMTSIAMPAMNIMHENMRALGDGVNSVLIAAIDKPRVEYDRANKQFMSYFLDFNTFWGHLSDDGCGGYHPNIEYFYYAPDFPKLYQKQCFMVKHAMEPIVRMEPPPAYYSRLHYKHAGKEVMDIHKDFFETLLYKNHDITIFQASKPTSLFYQESTKWFNETDLTDSRLKDFYNGQLKEILSGVAGYFLKYNEKGQPSRFTEIYTQPIYF